MYIKAVRDQSELNILIGLEKKLIFAYPLLILMLNNNFQATEHTEP